MGQRTLRSDERSVERRRVGCQDFLKRAFVGRVLEGSGIEHRMRLAGVASIPEQIPKYYVGFRNESSTIQSLIWQVIVLIHCVNLMVLPLLRLGKFWRYERRLQRQIRPRWSSRAVPFSQGQMVRVDVSGSNVSMSGSSSYDSHSKEQGAAYD